MSGRTHGARIARVRSGGADWLVREDLQREVLGHDAPAWFALAAGPRSECVKTGHNRAVWRVDAGGRGFFAKVVRPGSRRDRLKDLLIGTAAEREWGVLCEAGARGAPVVAPAAVGVRDGGSVLLTERFEDASSLADVWLREVACRTGSSRLASVRPLIDAVAGALARSHDVGFVHRDGHATNLLVHAAADDAFEVRYVDVLGATLCRRAWSLARVRSLAQLDHFFLARATSTERLRFLRAYWAQRDGNNGTGKSTGTGKSGQETRRLLTEISVARAAHAEHLARHRDRRLGWDGKYFAPLLFADRWRGVVCLQLERRHRFPEPGVPDRTVRDWRALLEPALACEGGDDAARMPDASAGVTLLRSERFGLIEGLRYALTGSPHRLRFELCHRNRHRDLATGLTLGYLEQRVRGVVRRSVLILPDECGVEALRVRPEGEESQ